MVGRKRAAGYGHLLSIAVAATGCGDSFYRETPFFEWDDYPKVGAYDIDRLSPGNPALMASIDSAKQHPGEVTVYYGHMFANAARPETIDAMLTRAEAEELPTFTFHDLVEGIGGERRSGIALTFDDDQVDEWFALRDIFIRHEAHASFFVTRYSQLPDDQKAKLHQLYAEGHSIEAHGVNHVRASEYLRDHTVEQMIDNEIAPSIDVLRADGFDPVAYAHPNGSRSPELDDAIVPIIPMIREISGRPR